MAGEESRDPAETSPRIRSPGSGPSGPDSRAQTGAILAYLRFLETLTAENLSDLRGYVAADVRFRDPFNDVTGREAMQRVFERMFEDLREVSFAVEETAVKPGVGFARWRFRACLARAGRRLDFTGFSEIHAGPDGLITGHHDVWDPTAALFDQVPVLGLILRRLKRRLTVN